MLDRFTRLYISAKTFVQPEDGQATTEYALVLALLVVGVVAAVGVLTGDMKDWIGNISTSISGNVP